MENQIAIDGPAASGKSTVARRLATALNGYYINTGEMYRALTHLALAAGVDPQADADAVAAMLPSCDLVFACNAQNEIELQLAGVALPSQPLRSPQVAERVSYVARIPAVREWMVERQRLTESLGLIIMEGRDIGTVVFPQAKYKFFVTASPEERARRRLGQSGETVDGATLASVAADIAARDEMDSTRAVSPLKPAEDAVLVDTTGLDIDAVVDTICGHIQS
ncbi:MAG: cytidylate kinase [Rhodothermales bacterium]|jgi:cytidylate kinase